MLFLQYVEKSGGISLVTFLVDVPSNQRIYPNQIHFLFRHLLVTTIRQQLITLSNRRCRLFRFINDFYWLDSVLSFLLLYL